MNDPTNGGDLASNSDPSPLLAAHYRDDLLAQLQQMGWSTSAAAEAGLSTTVMINDQMIGASVDMNALFSVSEGDYGVSGSQALPPITVFAFSTTAESPIPYAVSTVVRQGVPTVTVAHHRILDLLGCEVVVPVTADRAETTTRTIAALAASIEQLHSLVI